MKISSNYLLIIPFLLMLFLQQCKKDNPDTSTPTPVDYRANTVWGKVVDKTTGQGIAHARVYFLKAQNIIIGNPSWYTADAQYSDSSGNFSFSTIPNSDSIYSVYCTKNLFFDGDPKIIPYTNVGYAAQVQLQPMAWLKLHVKNVNPFDNFDKISFSAPWGGGLVLFMENL